MQSLKKYFFIIVLLVAAETVTAQTNPLEAKAAYLLAEESYDKGDMRAALQYIDDAISKLGKANAKILYLKVIVLKEINTKMPADTSVSSKLDLAIADFEKAPDYADFNEEKSLEVMKIKVARNRFGPKGSGSGQVIEAYQRETGWRLGVKLDSLQILHKEQFERYFQNFPSQRGKIGPDALIQFNSGKTNGAYEMVFTKAGALSTYINMFFYADDTNDFSNLKQESAPIIEKYRYLFGFTPEIEVKKSSPQGTSLTITTYTYLWKTGNIKFYLGWQEINTGSGYKSACFITISNDPEVK